MSDPNSHDVTQLLKAWSGGDQQALNELMPTLYAEIRKLAGSYLRRERPDHTLQATALGQRGVYAARRSARGAVAESGAFLRYRSPDHAPHPGRSRADAEGGEARERPEPDPPGRGTRSRRGSAVGFRGVDDALKTLAELDSRQAQIVELRFFGGLSIEETAEVTKLSPATIKREWASARAWLRRELERSS
jgi:RNA polymerase sigma factor (sigma-70 family)